MAKSLDFSDLIRLSPQNTNLLKRDPNAPSQSIRGKKPVRPPSRGRSRNLEADEQNQGLLLGPEALQKVSNAENPSIMAHLSSSKNHIELDTGSGIESYGRKLEKGTMGTLLVFGMICAAIIASLISLIWFVKSYKGGYQQDRDDESFDSSSLSSASAVGSCSSVGDPIGPDPEVELDFEFSEDVNSTSTTENSVNNNSSGIRNNNASSGQV